MRNTAGKWLAATATVSAVVGALLIPGSPAIAAEAAPSAATHALSTQQQARVFTPKVSGVKAVPTVIGSRGHICLKTTSYCIHSNGAGNQVTITNNSADYSNFTVVDTSTSNGYFFYQWQNGNGNCLREGTNNIVKIENGHCSASDNTDWWEFYQGAYVINDYYGHLMLVRGQPRTGFNVFAYSATSPGDWARWNVPT